MWASTLGVVAVGGATLLLLHRPSMSLPRNTIAGRLERVQGIDDAVRLLQRIARCHPTEDVVDAILSSLQKEGISEPTVQTLSQLHREFGDDRGARGSTINLVWSTVLHGITSMSVIIYDD